MAATSLWTLGSGCLEKQRGNEGRKFRGDDMRRYVSFTWLVFFLCIGCDDGNPQAENVTRSPESLSAGSQDELIGPSAFTGCREEPSSFIDLMWEKSNLNGERWTENVVLVVRNTADRAISIDAQLRCAGLLDQTASLALGSYALEVGQSIPITIEARKIPIQNLNGASQLLVRVVATLENANEKGSAQQTFQSTPLYYRHSPNYSRMLGFTWEHLVERHGGLLSDRRAGSDGAQQSLGRMDNGRGRFIEITDDDEAPTGAFQSQRGMAGGRLVRAAVSAGYEDKNGDIVESQQAE